MRDRSKKKLTAADRPDFRREMGKILHELGAQPAVLDQNMVIVCSRAADFDPTSNVLWELEANKSAVREDVQCTSCGSTLAMSNEAYGRYQALDKKPKACCIQCVSKLAEAES